MLLQQPLPGEGSGSGGPSSVCCLPGACELRVWEVVLEDPMLWPGALGGQGQSWVSDFCAWCLGFDPSMVGVQVGRSWVDLRSLCPVQ